MFDFFVVGISSELGVGNDKSSEKLCSVQPNSGFQNGEWGMLNRVIGKKVKKVGLFGVKVNRKIGEFGNADLVRATGHGPRVTNQSTVVTPY
jgi:hypothetical protein